MANDASNITLGTCNVTFNSVDLGHTKGGVEVNVTSEIREITVDEYGTSPVNAYTIGQRVEVKMTLSEFTWANLSKVIQDATLEAGATVDEVNIGKAAGNLITPQQLVLTPLNAAGYVITIYRAIPLGNVVVPFKTEEETVYEVTFVALIDEAKSNGEKIMRIGTAD
jgi:hypothetical protein